MSERRERHPLGPRVAELQTAIHTVKGVARLERERVRATQDPPPAQLLALNGAQTALAALRGERDRILGIMDIDRANRIAAAISRLDIPEAQVAQPGDTMQSQQAGYVHELQPTADTL